MPPTFLYLMALIVWVGFAVAVWAVASVLAVLPRSRRTGLRLASAMACTFPAVIAYQLLAAPIVAALLLGMRLFWKTLEPGPATTTSNPAVILVSVSAAACAFFIALGLSIAGFWEGWRVGWLLVPGGHFWSAVHDGPLFRTARFLRRHVFRSRVA